MKNFLLLALFALFFIACKKDSSDNVISPTVKRTLSGTVLDGYFITAIAFDKSGTAWLGTLNQGLIKYDGQTATVFDSTNSALTTASINDIKIDKSGKIWIGSDDLISFHGGKFVRYDPKTFRLPQNHISSIDIDGKGNIWFSCSSFRSGGLVKYDGQRFTAYTPENSKLPGNMIKSLVVDNSNRVWLAVNDGLAAVSIVRFENENWKVFSQNELGFKPYYFGNIVKTKENGIVASLDYGLSSSIVTGRPQIFQFNGAKANIISLPDEDQIIYSTHKIFLDRNEQLWASFFGEKQFGVYINGKWNLDKLDADGVFAFGQHPSGNVWLGTEKGVYIMK